MEIKDIVAFNAKATDALRLGHYNCAGKFFHSALLLLKTGFAQDRQPSFTNMRRDPVSCKLVKVRGTACRRLSHMQNHEGESFYLHVHAFHVELDETDNNSTQAIEWNSLSSVLFYNTALCYHLMGLLEAKSRYLKKALKTYNAVLDLIQQDDGKNVSLKLASLNNMGHLHSFFFDAEEKQRCLDEMSNILESVSESYLSANDNSLVHFQRNVVLSYCQECPAAPAA